jgi:hypothetical protein
MLFNKERTSERTLNRRQHFIIYLTDFIENEQHAR